jgi:general secretion pathway protein I
MGSHKIKSRRGGERGFTLLEALVALAVMSAGLAAIGRLGYSSLAAVQRAETRLALTSAARAALTALPAREAIRDGETSGAIFDDKWRLDAARYTGVPPAGPIKPDWIPQALKLSVLDARGNLLIVETVRLRRAGAR